MWGARTRKATRSCRPTWEAPVAHVKWRSRTQTRSIRETREYLWVSRWLGGRFVEQDPLLSETDRVRWQVHLAGGSGRREEGLADWSGNRCLPSAVSLSVVLRHGVKREVHSSNPGALPRRELHDLHHPWLQASKTIEEARLSSKHGYTRGHWRSSAPNQTGQVAVAVERAAEWAQRLASPEGRQALGFRERIRVARLRDSSDFLAAHGRGAHRRGKASRSTRIWADRSSLLRSNWCCDWSDLERRKRVKPDFACSNQRQAWPYILQMPVQRREQVGVTQKSAGAHL